MGTTDDEYRLFSKQQEKGKKAEEKLKKSGLTPREYLEQLKKNKTDDKPKGIRPYTKDEKDKIKYWEDKIIDNNKNEIIYKNTKKYEGKKVPAAKQEEFLNFFENNRINWTRWLREAKAANEIDSWISEIKQARRNGEIDKEQEEMFIRNSRNDLSNQLDMYRRNLEYEKELEKKNDPKKRELASKRFNEQNMMINAENKRGFKQQDLYELGSLMRSNEFDKANDLIDKIYIDMGMPNKVLKQNISAPKKRGRPPKSFNIDKINQNEENIKLQNKLISKTYQRTKSDAKAKKNEMILTEEHKKLLKAGKTLTYDKDLGLIMTGKSELIKKNGKYNIETDLKIKKGLNDNVKKGLRKSIIADLERKIKGSGIRNIELDFSDSE